MRHQCAQILDNRIDRKQRNISRVKYPYPRKGKNMTNIAKIDRKTIEGEIAKLSAIVASIKEKQGSAAKRQQNATLQALDTPLTEELVKERPDAPAMSTLGDLASYVQALDEWAAQVRNEVVSGILKENATGDDVSVLREQYTSTKDQVEALLTVAKMMGVDVDGLEVPHLRAGRPRGSTNSTPRKVGSKWQRFYRVVDGERKEQGDTQNTFSSFAWYYGAKILGDKVKASTTNNNGKGVPADVLEDHLRKVHNVESPKGKAWTVEVDGVTYGMDVTESPSSSDEEE